MKTNLRNKLQIITLAGSIGILLLGSMLFSCTTEKTKDAIDLDTPSNVIATPEMSGNTIQWDAVLNATYYRIYWSNQTSDVTNASNMIDKIGNTNYVHTGIEFNKIYYYRVSAVNSASESSLSSIAEAEIQLSIPTSPTNLRVTPGENKITILWDLVNMAQSYKLYWTSDGTEPSGKSPVIGNITANSYEHTGLDFDKTYKYKVSATNQLGESSLTSSAQGQPLAPPIAAPTGLQGSFNNGIHLTWNAYPVAGASITIMRGYTVIAEGIIGNSYTDSSPQEGKINKYKIKAVVPCQGESPWSSEVSMSVYATVYETERNGPETTLTTLDWCSFREYNTSGKECLIINGDYSVDYAGYNAYLYKYYDWDIFDLDWANVTQVIVEVLEGNTSGLSGMNFEVGVCYDNNHWGGSTWTSHSGNTFTWDEAPPSTTNHMWLMVSMPEDLVNYGSYNYSIKVTLNKN